MSILLLTSFFDTLLYVLISINRAINFQASLVLETDKLRALIDKKKESMFCIPRALNKQCLLSTGLGLKTY